MGRIFLPQFQHNKNAAVIDHAIDAKRLDAAFAEVANILNGGIDETNLADSTKFSTGSAAGAVATALAPAYSLVTLRGEYRNGRFKATGNRIYLGYALAGWTLVRATLRGQTNLVEGPYYQPFNGGTGLGNVPTTWTRDPGGASFTFTGDTNSVANAVSSTPTTANFVGIYVPNSTVTLYWATAEMTFRVPVIA